MHDAEKCPPQVQNEYTMAALSSIEKKLYRVQEKMKNLQLTLINVEEVHYIKYLMQYNEPEVVFNVTKNSFCVFNFNSYIHFNFLHFLALHSF